MGNSKIKNRQRNIVVAFRMSEEERNKLNERVRLCGYTKQDYMIKSALNQKLLVVGDKKVLREFKAQLNSIECELKRINHIDELDELKSEALGTILEIMLELNKQ